MGKIFSLCLSLQNEEGQLEPFFLQKRSTRLLVNFGSIYVRIYEETHIENTNLRRYIGIYGYNMFCINVTGVRSKICRVIGTRIYVYLSVSSLKQDGWLANGNHG